MIIYARGTALVEHGETSEQFEIFEGELDWQTVDSSERSMGRETIYQAVVEHEELGELRWIISEYPAGAEGIKETNVGKHLLINDFDYGIEEEPDFDGYDPADLPERFKQNPEWANALTHSSMVRYLVEWFHHFFEDPANDTPYNGREGGYLYLKGGPYSAEEELRESFEGIVNEDAILAAANKIQSYGIFDWAPSPRHPASIDFYDDGLDDPHTQGVLTLEEIREIAANMPAEGLGSDAEKAQRARLLEQIAHLQRDLPKPAAHGGIGHNHPPGEYELHGDELEETRHTVEEIASELSSETPDVEAVAEKTSRLRKLLGWVSKKLDTTVDAFCKSFGTTLGTTAGIGLPAALLTLPYWGKLAILLVSLKDWLLLTLGI